MNGPPPRSGLPMSNVFAERRARFLAQLPKNAAAVIGGNSEKRRNNTVHFPFRQRSDLLYLTGFPEPEALAVFTPGKDKPFTLLCRPRDKDREVWDGRRAGPEGAVERYGADQSFPIAEVAQRLPELLDGCEAVYLHPGDDHELDRRVLAAIAHLRAAERRGKRAPRSIVDIGTILHEDRLIKDDAAQRCLRAAAALSTEAHLVAMRATQPGLREHHLQALLEFVFRYGGGHPGYGTIVGAGRNATILHYVENDDELRPGELVLCDAGGEVAGFTADITRTYPIPPERGAPARFSPVQRRVYDVVLRAQRAGIALARPGSTIEAIHERCVRVLTEGMVELGLLSGDPDKLIADRAYERYYMHRTSHWLGLDVHDVGAYHPGGEARVLAPGMVLTIEPGLYISESDEQAGAMRGIGVRIEDDILITVGDPEVLTAVVPKDPEAIEAIVGKGGVAAWFGL